jgi:DNA-binding transcriptional MocR family regulator
VLGEPLGVDAALQRAIAQYMHRRSYDRHLRQLREALATRTRQGMKLISQHFPLSCAVSRPTGGFMCWIRGPQRFNAMEAADEALRRSVSIPPGPMCSVTGSFRNFVSLNLSYPWDDVREKKLLVLAELMAAAEGGTAQA